MDPDLPSPQYSGRTFNERCPFHTDYIIRVYVFHLNWFILKLSVDIFLMSVKQVAYMLSFETYSSSWKQRLLKGTYYAPFYKM